MLITVLHGCSKNAVELVGYRWRAFSTSEHTAVYRLTFNKMGSFFYEIMQDPFLSRFDPFLFLYRNTQELVKKVLIDASK